MPLHGPDGDAELPGDLFLFLAVDVVRDHNLSLHSGQVGDLLLQAVHRFPVVIRFLRGKGGDIPDLLQRYADPVPGRVTIVIAERIVHNRPHEPFDVLHIVTQQQCPVDLQDNLLGKVFGVFGGPAALERESEHGLHAGFQDRFHFRLSHGVLLSAVRLSGSRLFLKAFTYTDTARRKRLGSEEIFFQRLVESCFSIASMRRLSGGWEYSSFTSRGDGARSA